MTAKTRGKGKERVLPFHGKDHSEDVKFLTFPPSDQPFITTECENTGDDGKGTACRIT